MSLFRRRLMMAQGGGGIPSEDGVYIQSIDGKFYTYDEWNLPNEQANGVAVISSEHPDGGFVIAKTESVRKTWGMTSISVSGIVTTNDINTAKEDLKGFHNTYSIISQDSYANAAIYCNEYVFPNGNAGYLPSAGELVIAYKSKVKIENCLLKIGSISIKADDGYWSSTQVSLDSAWIFDFNNSNLEQTIKYFNRYCIPFTTLK